MLIQSRSRGVDDREQGIPECLPLRKHLARLERFPQHGPRLFDAGVAPDAERSLGLAHVPVAFLSELPDSLVRGVDLGLSLLHAGPVLAAQAPEPHLMLRLGEFCALVDCVCVHQLGLGELDIPHLGMEYLYGLSNEQRV